MKKILLSLGTLALLVPSTFSQDFSLVSANEELILVNHQLSEAPEAVFTTIGDADFRDFSKSHKIVSMEAGSPSLPFFTESVIVPNNGKIDLDVTYTGYTEYEDVLIAPSKGSLKRNVLPSEVPFVFGESYSTDAFFPGELATVTTPFNLRSTRGATIIVNPYQYNPVTKVLRIYDNIYATVTIDDTETGINELTPRLENSAAFSELYKDMYLNPSYGMNRYTPEEEEGDMLIISANSFIDEIEPLAVWKTQEGIKTTVVAREDIGSTDIAIKSYIEDAYSANPALVFVLLVGDHGQVPSHTYGASGWEELWSDSYYGQMSGDLYPELFVGRFSGTSSDIETMVERTIEYEKTPASGEWMSRAIGLASNEGDGYGDDGEPDWEHARNNRAKLMDYGYTQVHEFYDGSHGGEDASGNPSSSIINPAVEDGIGLFNYTGHGDEMTCITGNYSSSNINAAKNNGKYPFVVSVACNNGTFTSGTCISETWLRAKHAGSPTGAIAAAGSTILMAWAEPMQTQDEMAAIIAENYAANKKETIGGIFYNSQISMLEDYGASSTAKEVMQTWVLFGDPSTLFRNQETMTFDVSHFYNVPDTTTSFNVNCDNEDATAAIVQDGVLLGTAKIVGGTATITFPALATDQPLLLTITQQNYKPYQAVITVGDGPAGLETEDASSISVYPNPATEMVTVNWTKSDAPSLIELRDLSGKIIYTSSPIGGSTETIETSAFAKGIYILNVTVNGNVQTTKLIIR